MVRFAGILTAAGGDKTAWLLDALRSKLNQPESNPQLRVFELVERMEVAAAAPLPSERWRGG